TTPASTRCRSGPGAASCGAHADMLRLANWISANAAHIDQITVTLDSHQSYDIAHPAFWAQWRHGETVHPDHGSAGAGW
ncbi:hypothetical protein J4711_13645, partial [Staphylococcus epidermidis]|nr:hypothetical protein [Staphylococcus epidermidis]